MPSIAENLRRLRQERGFTQDTLAGLAGLKQSAISRYEKGKVDPDVSSLLKLATGLQVPLETLVEGVDVRFDLVYQGLKATISMPEPEPAAADLETQPRVVPEDVSLDQILPGYQPPQADSAGGADEPHEDDLAPPEAILDRIMGELLTLRGRVVTGSAPMDGRGRPRSPEGPARRRVGGRGKTPKKAPKTRPPR